MQQRWPLFKVLALTLTIAVGFYFLSHWLLTVFYPMSYQESVFARAAEFGVDPYLVTAVIRRESGFRPGVTSPQGARGLMQIMPETGAWVAEQIGVPFAPEQLYDPAYNIHLGTWYLAYLHVEFGGNTAAALAAYNGGQNNVRQWLRERTWDGQRQTIERIPFGETREYVRGVLRDHALYRKLYAQ